MQRQRSRAHCFSLQSDTTHRYGPCRRSVPHTDSYGDRRAKRPRAKQEGFWKEARIFTVLKLASSLSRQNKQTKLKHQKGMIFGGFCLTRFLYFRVFVCIL